MDAHTTAGDRLLRLPEVLARIGIRRSAWFARIKAGSAPQPIHVGRAACWPESEVQRWIADQVRRSRTGAEGER
jgi:prophage regulatory protein